MSILDYCIQRASEIPFKKGEKRFWSVVIDKRGRIVSESSNSYVKTHRQMHDYSIKSGSIPEKCFLHSEIGALIKDKKRKGVKLIVARVDSKGNPCIAKPCAICSVAIAEFINIKSVEYTV